MNEYKKELLAMYTAVVTRIYYDFVLETYCSEKAQKEELENLKDKIKEFKELLEKI